MLKSKGKRQLQKEATREHIIKTAIQVYARQGFSVPTNIIAQEAGLAHGSIFVHFATREDMQENVLNKFSEDIGEKLQSISLSGDISELLYAHINILEEYESFYRELISEMTKLPDGTRSIVIALQSIMSRHFDAVIEKGRKNGVIKDIPLHMLFNIWIALLHYYLQNAELFAPSESVLRRYKDELVSNYLALIKK